MDFDRPQEQRWAQFMGSLIGLGMESLLQRESVPDSKYKARGSSPELPSVLYSNAS